MSASIPLKTTVLVVGGGPGGSYAASALAREGIDTTVLEADIFPRYHVGESMVASIRHFLRFIDLDTTFNNHGFVKKTGAAFKLNNKKEAYTDFIVEAGPDAYAWNVIRSESDDLIFRHAGKCGAHIFDGVKVSDIQFESLNAKYAADESDEAQSLGRPVSATWTKKDGTIGQISFDYLVDASGRAGIMSTKYLKNRSFNTELKNVASWGYWRGAIQYGEGTTKVGQPFFEALQDGSGWAWFIPLHNGTVSIGVVQNQNMATDKKRAQQSVTSKDFYFSSIQEARGVAHLLEKAHLDSDIKHASDWSYSASQYASPFTRIVGDAGAFIDPYFSSGVHLALSGALSAAVTICGSIKGQSSEHRAWKWHSQLTAERYTRFLLVVLSATKQIRSKDIPVLNGAEDEDFDDAFSIIRPVIQGIADVNGKVTKEEISRAVDFTLNTVEKHATPARKAEIEAETEEAVNKAAKGDNEWVDVTSNAMDAEEAKILKMVKNVFADFFSVDSHGGMVANLEHGALGLKPAYERTVEEEKIVEGKDKVPGFSTQEILVNQDSPMATQIIEAVTA